jgi:hypothetical protein
MMKSPLLLLGAALLAASSLQAQQQQPVQLKMGDIKVGSPSLESQKTPNFQAGDVKVKNIPNPRDWLEIEIEFEVAGDRKAVVKELLFRYYVAMRDQTNQIRTLTGDVKHINVVCREKTYSCAYVAPAVLGEITGDFRRFNTSSVEAVGLEIIYNGVVVGGTSTKGGSFWQSTGTQPGVLGKAETPFALLWIDRYAEVDRSSR